MLKRTHYLFSALLFGVLGIWMLPSCTDLLGINTDHNENPCNNLENRPDPIECGKGACHVFLDFCDEIGLPVECVPGPGQEVEVCPDGIDNNCDGQVDENVSPECKCTIGEPPKNCFSGSATERSVGVCDDGQQDCENGSWGVCTGDVLPSKEIPNGFDDDCDGSVDEDFDCQEGAQQYCYDGPPGTLTVDDPNTPQTEQAPCKQGTQTCTKEGQWGECLGSVGPALEECDGIDNDCNGDIDDIPAGGCECIPDGPCYTGPELTKGVGECKGGKWKCVNGKPIACEGEVLPSVEICDGKDHDCNGVVDNYDEDDPKLPCVCEFGAQRECYEGTNGTQNTPPCKTGIQACVKGKWGPCDGQVVDSPESCNNIDDDCSGQVDDGVPEVGDPCVLPEYLVNSLCYQGTKVCQAATMMPACVPKKLPNSEMEIPCNNFDEDCNGLVDDGMFCCFGDGIQNGNETDADCGGKCDTKCGVGDHCKVNVDCMTGVCTDTLCFPATCGDNVKNDAETDVDCGGGTCAKCVEGKDCKIDSDCISNVCDPNSKKCAKKPIGASCVLNNECQTSYCIDGFCCDSQCNGTCQACSATKKGGGSNGFCGNMPVGADPDEECGTQDPSTCGTNGVCDGAGACQKHVSSTECLAASCANATTVQKAKTCNGFGTCEDKGTTSCEPYTCASGTCKSICASDMDCAMSAYCNVPTCLPKKPLGTPCGLAKECASGNCVDGVCCDMACSGICQACIAAKKGSGGGIDGTCGPIGVNTDPDAECNEQETTTCGTTGSCDGVGACQKYAAGIQCAPAMCANATTLNKVSLCPGGGASCPPAMPQDCTPYVCTTGAGVSFCRTDCQIDSHCASGFYCNGQSCLMKKPTPSSCGLDHECLSNFCANNVCCNTACNGSCQSCLAVEKGSGFDGVCGNVAANTDPQNDCTEQLVSTCGLTGECNGAGACQKYPANTVCTAASCAGTTLNPVKICDGVGTCAGAASQNCAPYACATNGCPSICTNDLECSSGNYCMMSSCVAKKPISQTCSAQNECALGNCVDGVCCDTACAGTCQACNLGGGATGTCTTVPNGTSDAGTCNSPNVCNAGICKKGNGESCSAPNECSSTNCVDGRCCGDASCGTCQACNVVGSFGTCTNVANGTADPGTCDSPSACTAGVCKKANGQTCTGGTECQSASCVDGVCCGSASCGTCEACNIVGSLGACMNLANGVSDAGTCDSPNSCAAGVCKKVNGQMCGTGNDCQSSNCIDGVCCNTTCTGTCQACNASGSVGTCMNVATGMSDTGTCDAPNTCAAGVCKKVNGQTCGGGSECQSNNCIDSVCCNTTCTDTCQSCNVPGSLGVCSNVTDGTADPGTCGTPSLCTAGVCKKIDGQTCGTGNDCQSNNCVDGVCCGSASCSTCQACNVSGSLGTCANVTNGTSDPGTCDSPNTCTGGACKKANGQLCAVGPDCQSGNCIDGVCCNTTCTGTCQACNVMMEFGTCTTATNGTSDPDTCASPSTCTGGACKKADGQLCAVGTECQSANCVDGVCCNTTCTGTCQACNVAGSVGACVNVTNGTSDPGTCDSPNTCTGGACKKADGQLCAVGTECQSANCVDGVCCGSGSCGICQACNVAGSLGTCSSVTNGTADPDTCANPSTCMAGVCEKINGQACTAGSGCQSGNCVDGYCCNTICTGTCQACNLFNTFGVCTNVNGAPDPDTCASPSTCTGGSCKKADGAVCGVGTDCQSGNCIDGVCCDTSCTGTCQACNVMMSFGTCTNVTDDTSDPDTCASPSICTGGSCKKPDGLLCGVGTDCQSGNCIDGVCCDTSCTGACQACNVMMSFGTCTNVTDGTSDPDTCASPSTCSAGSCENFNGAVCGVGTDCQSGNCIDGVCCDTSCTGMCQACNLSGSVGTCTNVPAGTDPDDECDGATPNCDGSGTCN